MDNYLNNMWIDNPLFDSGSYVTREGDRFCFRLIGDAQMREALQGILSDTDLA